MRRLYLRIYIAVLASLVLFVLLAGLTFKLFDRDDESGSDLAHVVSELAAELLPADNPASEQQIALDRWHRKFKVHLSLYDGDGRLLAFAGERQSRPPNARLRRRAREGQVWVRDHRGPLLLFALPQDRYLAVVDTTGVRGWRPSHKGVVFVVGLLSLVGIAVAIVAWPLARRITRRLEHLQQSVQAFGQGNLSVRANIKGSDEVARLAHSFNWSADHIEQLVAGQRTLLANASHELRSPLARIRLAAELLADRNRTDEDNPASSELLRNVAELDALVDEILLASRLETQAHAQTDRAQWSELDLGGLIAEEAARCGLAADVSATSVHGDVRLLRRLVRNLIENALRYGVRSDPSSDIAVSLVTGEASIVVSVCDRGPGVPEAEREKIFEAFYRASGASERSGGVGLGLSLVRQIAQHHGGQVRCEDNPDGGSCFVVSLPSTLLAGGVASA